jgi:hypothetical protein
MMVVRNWDQDASARVWRLKLAFTLTNPTKKTKVKDRAASTHWVYADSPIYAFHARLPMPPELAVVTLKRFWSGQITTSEIVEICRRRQTEQLFLSPVSRRNLNWTSLLATGFDEDCEEGNLKLYEVKRRDQK